MNSAFETLRQYTQTGPAVRYSARRNVHHVDFFCDAPGARRVFLIGDFNGWDVAATPMHQGPDRRWTASLELHHGHHQYLFIVDGEPKLDQHAAGTARNERNDRVSLIAVS
jgi:1,4-alpha-glucan branching enzyme